MYKQWEGDFVLQDAFHTLNMVSLSRSFILGLLSNCRF